MKKDYCLAKKDKKKKKDKGKKKQEEPIVKIEEINALSGDIEEGDILLNSGLELSQFLTTDDIVVQD